MLSNRNYDGMKIGIITFHAARNYGAVLQAYALQTHLKKAGHQPFFINYQFKGDPSPYSPRAWLSHTPHGVALKINGNSYRYAFLLKSDEFSGMGAPKTWGELF